MLLGTGLVVTIMYVVINLPQDNIVYEREEVEVTKEVTPDWASDEEAVKAAQAVIRKKELQTELATVNEEIKVKQTRKTEIEKELGTYWRDKENVKRLIRETFPESPIIAVEVARLETDFQMVQSNHIYTRDNPKLGIKAGEKERSFCMYQIHEPAHKETIEALGLQDFKTNVESCLKMARVVYEQAGHSFKPWTVYKDTIAMR